MLSCYRILDLTDEKGFLCGKVLGDLGADVIKIEKPGGDASRNRGPFYHDIPDGEKSLYWFAFNASKRGITLDIEKSDGREIFKRLVQTADVVVESFAPGRMQALGLGYEVLREVNPGIILTSITGFGQEGPYANYNDRDIAVWALSGFMYAMGEPDRPPLAPSYRHAHLIGAVNGAVGTAIALFHRAKTGEGQRVDSATQQGLCFAISTETKTPWATEKVIITRHGRNRTRIAAKDGETWFPFLWECKDGSVILTTRFGIGSEKSNQMLVDWIEGDGIDAGVLRRIDWRNDDWGKYTVAELDEMAVTIGSFLRKHAREELLEGALERRIQLTPVLTPKDQLEFPQLVAREFWQKVEHPELGADLTYPGGFVRLSDGECRIRRRAPLIGEHNEEIYGEELGLSKRELLALKERQVI